jgi:hypothetical protein
MKRAIAAPVVLLLGLAVVSPPAAYAAVVKTIVAANTADVLGAITFPALSGSAKDGVLFSFAGFSETDITSIDWTLDPSTEGVTVLGLHAFQGDALCPPVGPGVCCNNSLTLSSSVASWLQCRATRRATTLLAGQRKARKA